MILGVLGRIISGSCVYPLHPLGQGHADKGRKVKHLDGYIRIHFLERK